MCNVILMYCNFIYLRTGIFACFESCQLGNLHQRVLRGTCLYYVLLTEAIRLESFTKMVRVWPRQFLLCNTLVLNLSIFCFEHPANNPTYSTCFFDKYQVNLTHEFRLSWSSSAQKLLSITPISRNDRVND